MTNRILVLTQLSLNAFFDSMTLSRQIIYQLVAVISDVQNVNGLAA